MTSPLALAAPERLISLAFCGARAPADQRRHARKATAAVRYLVKASACAAWISKAARLSVAPAFSCLDRTGQRPEETDAPPEKASRRRRKAAPLADKGPGRSGPVYAQTPGRTSSAPPTYADKREGKPVMPPPSSGRIAPARLRAMAGPEAAERGEPRAIALPRRVPTRGWRPAATPKDPPRTAPADLAAWRSRISEAAASRRAPHGSTPSRTAGPGIVMAAWTKGIDGTRISTARLARLASPRPVPAASDRPARQEPPPADRARRPRARPEFAGVPPAAPGRTGKAPLTESLRRDSAFAESGAVPARDRRASDALEHDTLSPPTHPAFRGSPPQPDLAHPLAEVVPFAERPGPAAPQSVVADEVPEPPRLRAEPDGEGPRFDRHELTDALAQILRDEARRYGIDV
jgi:hypothetical protein